MSAYKTLKWRKEHKKPVLPLKPADEQLGIAWWNELSHKERMTALAQAGQHMRDPSVADAYIFWRQGVISTDGDPS